MFRYQGHFIQKQKELKRKQKDEAKQKKIEENEQADKCKQEDDQEEKNGKEVVASTSNDSTLKLDITEFEMFLKLNCVISWSNLYLNYDN